MDLAQPLEGIVHAQLQMLGSDLVGDIDDDVQIIGDNDLAVIVDRRARDLPAVEQGYLLLQFITNSLRKRHGISDQ